MTTSVDQLLSLENEEFLRLAYRALLRRQPDPDGMAHYLRRLNSGVDKSTLLYELYNSAEGRQKNRMFGAPAVVGLTALLNAERARVLVGPARFEDLQRQNQPLARQNSASQYNSWIRQFDELSAGDVELIREQVASTHLKLPLVVMRFDAVSEANVEASIRSLRNQITKNWRAQVYLGPDCSEHSVAFAMTLSAEDQRLSVVRATGTTAPPELYGATTVLLTSGEVILREHALYMFALGAMNADASVVYSDEDVLDESGHRVRPTFKPKFSPELLHHRNYLGRCTLVRAETAVIGKIVAEFLSHGADVQALSNILPPASDADTVIHIPHVLFHDTVKRGRDQEQPRKEIAFVLDDCPPSVSIIVPTKDRPDLLRPCLESVLKRTSYPVDRFEIVVVDNGSEEEATIRMLQEFASSQHVRVVRDPSSYNFSRLNNKAAEVCQSDILLFLNNDTVVNDSLWLHRFAQLCRQDDVAVVGCKLLYPDGTVQHGGVVVGIETSTSHCHVGIARNDPGFQGLANITREVSAVTGACMAIRRQVFKHLGGLDERLAVSFNDTDLCLRALRKGYRNLYIGEPLVFHYESATRGADDTPEKIENAQREAEAVRTRYVEFFRNDPYYSPNLSVERLYELAFPPRSPKPWGKRTTAGEKLRILFLTTCALSSKSNAIPEIAAALTSSGHDVFLGGGARNSRSGRMGCQYVDLVSPEEAASFAYVNHIDCIVAYDWPFYRVARWIGDCSKVICCDQEIPREVFADERERMEAEKRLCFSMSHGVLRVAVRAARDIASALEAAIEVACKSTALQPAQPHPAFAPAPMHVIEKNQSEATRSGNSGDGDRREFYARLRDLHGKELVESAYLAILGRHADPSGRAYYIDRLSQGTPREQVIWEIASSEEAKSREINPNEVLLAARVRHADRAETTPKRKISNILRIQSKFGLGSLLGKSSRLRMAAKNLQRVLSRSSRAMDVRVRVLSRSVLLDVVYVCKQLGVTTDDAEQVARLYYQAQHKRRVRPNPLFDPEYYRHINGLDHDIDPIEHYLAEGAARHLACHRLFDGDWYKEQLPAAAAAPDLLAHYWRVGYLKHILPVNPTSTQVLSEIEALYFADPESTKFKAFDARLYRGLNPDLADKGDRALHDHHRSHGQREGRIASMHDFFRATQSLPRFVPVDFTPRGYADAYLDLTEVFENNWGQYLLHYLGEGLREGRASNLSDLFGPSRKTHQQIAAGTRLALNKAKTPLCVLMHLYYPEMWTELSGYLGNIEVPFDLYVNLVDTTWTVDVLRKIRAERPHARVYISENSGRDIGGFMRLLGQINFDDYIAFATLHSKKSPHVTSAYAERWKKSLLGAILGSPDIATHNMATFVENSRVGIIASAQNRSTTLGNNERLFKSFLDLYNITEEFQQCEYVSGTMMLIRSEIMKRVYEPLRGYDFKNGDNKELAFHVDGQAEHAVERIFGNVMKQLGYEFMWC